MDNCAPRGGSKPALPFASSADSAKALLSAGRRARQPLYMHLAQQLREGLRQGHWSARQALPSERELADLLRVSRETARKALDLLSERGWLMRVPGSGTYAATVPVDASAPTLVELAPTAQTLGRRRRRADALEQRVLGLAEGGEVWQSLSLACSPTGAPELRCCVQPCQAHLDPCWALRLYRIEAMAANAQQALYLGLHSGEAVLRVSHLQCNPQGRAMALLHSDCKGAEASLRLQTSLRD